MARNRTVTDEEMERHARALQAEGQLTTRALQAAVGGDYKRACGWVQKIREEVGREHKVPFELADPDSAEPGVKALADVIQRAQDAAVEVLRQTRRQDAAHHRHQEDALRERHASEMQAAMAERAQLHQDWEDAVAALAVGEADLAALQEELLLVRKELSTESHKAAELVKAHHVERVGLREQLASAHEELARATDAREAARVELHERMAELRIVREEADRERERTSAALMRAEQGVREIAVLTVSRDRAVQAEAEARALMAEFEAAVAELRDRNSSLDGEAKATRKALNEFRKVMPERQGSAKDSTCL